jgi:hypothetical protein
MEEDMEESEMKKWIDEASYEELLTRLRFEPTGAPWFQNSTGDYYAEIMHQKGSALSTEERVQISKRVGLTR